MKLLKNQRLSHKVQLPNQPSVYFFQVILAAGIYILLLIYLITVLFQLKEFSNFKQLLHQLHAIGLDL